MSDGSNLRKAIIAQPDEDTPRLVYADWLDENGQPERAHVVRDMVMRPALYDTVAMANATFGRASRGRDEGRGRVCQWLGTPGGADGELARLVGGVCSGVPGAYVWDRQRARADGPPLYVVWRRGFIEEVKATAADWLACGDAIRGHHPATRVTLTSVPLAVAAAGGLCLKDDPAAAVMSLARLRALTPPTNDLLAAMCRLRWPGVTFALPRTTVFYRNAGTVAEPVWETVDPPAALFGAAPPALFPGGPR